MSWLPPLYNAEHVSTTDPNTGAAWVGEVPGRSLYRATCLLGPITVQVAPKSPRFLVIIDIDQAVAATLSEAMTSLGPHISSLLRTRDLTKLTSSGVDPAKGVYVGGQDIIKVMMEEAGEGGRPVAVLPPLDLHILQSKVAGGRLPPGYGLRDEYNCIKLALCQLCSSRLPATHEALKQVINWSKCQCHAFFAACREFKTSSQAGKSDCW